MEMSVYQIKTADWPDIEYLQDLGANGLRSSPLTNSILTSANGVSSNNVQSRNAFAQSIYQQALHAQDEGSPSKVLKAVNTSKSFPQTQACAWVQWVPPDMDINKLRSEELNSGFQKPPCVNFGAYFHVESAKLEHRETWTKGKPYYRTLSSLTAFDLDQLTYSTVIRTLDFEPNYEGMTAARDLLLRIHLLEPRHAAFAHTKIEHETLYLEFGWQNVGDVLFMDIPAATGEPYRLRTFLRPGSQT